MTTTEPTYLGAIDGEHWWSDGTRLPVLVGFDGDGEEDEEQADTDDDGKDDGDIAASEDDDAEEDLEDPRKIKDPKRARSARQAAQYRTQRNKARRERDELRMEVAFLRAAGAQFVDTTAAWKLADRSMLTVNDDGTVTGADEAVEALAESQPFLLAPAPDDKPTKDRNPFKEASAPVRKMNGKKQPLSSETYDVKRLEAKYPAMRGRR